MFIDARDTLRLIDGTQVQLTNDSGKYDADIYKRIA